MSIRQGEDLGLRQPTLAQSGKMALALESAHVGETQSSVLIRISLDEFTGSITFPCMFRVACKDVPAVALGERQYMSITAIDSAALEQAIRRVLNGEKDAYETILELTNSRLRAFIARH